MIRKEPATTTGRTAKETEVGSVFVSNYPPYSFWDREGAGEAQGVLAVPPSNETPLGLYLHIPFCRRRCKFCYFKVYTDKNSADVDRYLAALTSELRLLAATPRITDRKPRFVYFGGGTPSFISARHLRHLVEELRATIPWDGVEEVTFECEPGTLTRPKLEAIRDVGITRISLGVENFDDTILAENGRAHVSKEIYRVVPWIEELGFEQFNLDLIAGMVGETWETWRETVRKTLEIGPGSVTIYQMELPFNTVYSRNVLQGTAVQVADWVTKRQWHDYAFAELQTAGYEISSAYTMVRGGRGGRFVYRDAVWRGCDLLGIGVSSFSHIGGVHYQNLSEWNGYLARTEENRLPIDRAYVPTERERMTREVILQLKLGALDAAYFRSKFDVEIVQEFGDVLSRLERQGMLGVAGDTIRLTRKGLLQVDGLLPEFYAPRYQNARYT